MPDEGHDLIALTADIVSAHVAHNQIHSGELPRLIGIVFQALSKLGAPAAASVEATAPQPATTTRKSLSRSSHILSMIDGQPYKTLRRHIGRHGYTPESYRETFGLPRDYPMVAPDYSDQRRAVATKIGLGRKAKANAGPVAATEPSSTAARLEAPSAGPTKPVRRTLKPAFGDAVAAAKSHLGGS